MGMKRAEVDQIMYLDSRKKWNKKKIKNQARNSFYCGARRTLGLGAKSPEHGTMNVCTHSVRVCHNRVFVVDIWM